MWRLWVLFATSNHHPYGVKTQRNVQGEVPVKKKTSCQLDSTSTMNTKKTPTTFQNADGLPGYHGYKT